MTFLAARSRSKPDTEQKSLVQRLRLAEETGATGKAGLFLAIVFAVNGYLRSFLWEEKTGSTADASEETAKPEEEEGGEIGRRAGLASPDEDRKTAAPSSDEASEGPSGMLAVKMQSTQMDWSEIIAPVDVVDTVEAAFPDLPPETSPKAVPVAIPTETGIEETVSSDETQTEEQPKELASPEYRTPVFMGTDGDDLIAGTNMSDRIEGRAGNDQIHALGGDDVIDAGAGNDRVVAGAGDDIVLARSGDDVVFGGTGSDRVLGGEGNDRIWGGDDADDLLGEAGNDLIDGGFGNDFIDGGDGNDVLYGAEGADVLVAGTGDDAVDGGDGDDLIDGGSGNDTILGGAGDDLIIAGTGDDVVLGDAGNDIFVVSADGDDDTYSGGSGVDTLDVSSVADDLRVEMGEGLLSSDSCGEDRFDSIEILILGSGDDYVLFSDAGCTVNGGDGADRFDFSEISVRANPETIYNIRDFQTGDLIRIGQSDFFRPLISDDRTSQRVDREDDDSGRMKKAFGLDSEEFFEDGHVRLTFANRVEADRVQTLLQIDFDKDGVQDCLVQIDHVPSAIAEEDEFSV